MKRHLLVAAVAASALFVSGCSSSTSTVTGSLVGADGACLYLRAQDAKADLYWLRTLPTGYTADADGLAKPDGSRVKMGDSVTATGTLSWAPLDRQCENGHTCG